jgi:hypothetical protein
MGFKFNPTTGSLDLVGSSAGPSVDPSILSYVAGETISALKCVYVKHSDGLAYVAKSGGLSSESVVVGIAKNAALVGESVSVQILGEIEDGSWSWSANDLVYLSNTGSIKSSAPGLPLDLYHVVIGKVLTNNKIIVAIEAPITL